MSLRKLVEGDCGGVNPLMQLGTQLTRDVAHIDEGFSRVQYDQQNEHMLGNFPAQIVGPPNTFRMDALLQEMCEIQNVAAAEMQTSVKSMQPMADYKSTTLPQHITNGLEFFEDSAMPARNMFAPVMPRFMPPAIMPAAPMAYAPSSISGEQFFAEAAAVENAASMQMEGESLLSNVEFNEAAVNNYNEKFWQRLQAEWSKLSEESEHPWLSDYDINYDPHKDYEYVSDNPMSDLTDAFERGKEYLERGDIPSAVLCFEAATQQQPDNAEIWELLGMSQAENEMDPQSIAALKRVLELQPDNSRAIMALAVCYTNESLQQLALNMLVRWLDTNPKYKHLIEQNAELRNTNGQMYSSMASSSRLQQLQQVFEQAAQLNGSQLDANVLEALGVLYNLSADFEKAADSFRSALSVDSNNAKIWNRLGASLANGSRSNEAVQAYQRALALQPGFIRVRYNVGVCCMNLKAYAQAAEHFLTALNMQANAAADRDLPLPEGAASVASGQQKMSNSIWSTLKMVLSLLGRNELQSLANDRNLTALNKEFNLQ